MMFELLYNNLRKMPAIRRRALEYKDVKFDKEGLTYIDGKPFWIHNGRAYYIFLLANLSGRFIQFPVILDEIAESIAKIVDFSKIDKILTLEAMGLHIATAVAMKTNRPLVIAGKYRYHDEITGWEPSNQMEVVKHTGYGESRLYINDVYPGDRILLLDSIISTGGSFTAIIKVLKKKGIDIKDAVAIIEKTDYKGPENVKRATGVTVKTLFKIKIRDVKETPNGLVAYNDVITTKLLTHIVVNKLQDAPKVRDY